MKESHRWEKQPEGDLMPSTLETDRDILPVEWHGAIGGEKPDPDVWEGSASAKGIEFGQYSQEFYQERIPYYYGDVTLGAPVRCVEKRFSGAVGILYDLVQDKPVSPELVAQVLVKEQGRFSSRILRGNSGYLSLAEMAQAIRSGEDVTSTPLFQQLRAEVEEEPLGPQTVGGTVAMAYAYRVAVGVKEGATLPGDVEIVASIQDEFKAGNHKDEHAVFPKIGCTAVDKDETILYKASSALTHGENQRLTRFLLGYKPDDSLEHQAYVGYSKLNNPDFKDVYFMRRGGVATHRQAGLDTLERAHGSEIEIVTGGFENALFFLINRKKGQTFHKNLWALDLMGMGVVNPPGAYNLDFWRSEDRAATLFPDDEPARRRFMKARCLYNASTLMALCDGSLVLGERKGPA